MSGFDWLNLSPVWDEFSVRLSLTLLHSLWQGIVIAAIAAVTLRWLRRSTANSRYVVAGLALLCLPAVAAITYSTVEVPAGHARQDVPQLSEISLADANYKAVDDASALASVDHPMSQTFESRPSSVLEPRPESASLIADIPVVPIESEKVVANRWLTPLLPWLSTAYLIGVIAMLIRLLLGVWGGFRLRSQSTLATETGLLSVVGELSTKLGLKLAPTIYYCERVAAPAVIGILKPAILLPASIVTSLSPTELAAILSHELAHIRRGDLALQFVQRFIETLFFFHPATWWLSARVNDERENCCDDLAASAGFGNIGYATALLRVAELCVSKKPSQAVSSVGVLSADGSNSRQLSRRIERQLNMNSSPRLGSRLSFVLIALVAVCCIASVGAMTIESTDTAMVALKPTFDSAVILESEMSDAPIPSAKGSSDKGMDSSMPSENTVPASFVLPDHRTVMSVVISPDGKSIVSLSFGSPPYDGNVHFWVRTWDVSNRELVSTVELDCDPSWNPNEESARLSGDGTKVISVLDSKRIGIWDVTTGKFVKRLSLPETLSEDFLNSKLDCTADLSRIVGGVMSRYYASAVISDSYAVVWDGHTGAVLQTVKLEHANTVRSLDLSVDGSNLAAVGIQNSAEVWDVGSGKRLLNFRNTNTNLNRKHPDPAVKSSTCEIVSSVGFSADGNLIATSDMLGVKLIDSRSGEILHVIDAPYRYHSRNQKFVFSPDGRMLALTGAFGRTGQPRVVPVWSTATGKLLMTLPIDANDVSFSAGSDWLVAGTTDNEQAIAVWEIGKDDSAKPDVVWGKVDKRTGLTAGAKLLSATGKLQPGDPVVVQFLLRNDSAEEQTVVLQQTDAHPVLGSNNRVSLNVVGNSRNRKQHVLKPGAVLENRTYRLSVDTTGWPQGSYQVTARSAFWMSKEDNPNLSTGIPHGKPISFTLGDSKAEQLAVPPQDADPKKKIYWGKPAAGVCVGMRLPAGRQLWPDDGADIQGQLFGFNGTDEDIEFEYEVPFVLADWNMHVTSRDHDQHVRLDSTWYTGWQPPKRRRVVLKPNEIIPLTGIRADVEYGSLLEKGGWEKKTELIQEPSIEILKTHSEFEYGDPKRLIGQAGRFNLHAAITIHRKDIPDISVVASSGPVPFEIDDGKEDPEKSKKTPNKPDIGDKEKTLDQNDDPVEPEAEVGSKSVELRFIGADNERPIAGLVVEGISTGDLSQKFGPLTTNEKGSVTANVPFGFYRLRLTSEQETSYLPIDKFWKNEPRKWRRDLNLSVKDSGVEKWLDGKRRQEGYEAPKKPGDAATITYHLLPACELVLRAVDAETGEGIPGVEFHQENALAEDWGHSIYGHNIGWKKSSDVKAGLTDRDGYFRRLVSANAGFTYFVFEPQTQTALTKGATVDIVNGQTRAEHVFKLSKKIAPRQPKINPPTKHNDSANLDALVKLDETSQLPDIRIEGKEVTVEMIEKMTDRKWGTVTFADAKFNGAMIERLRHIPSIRKLRLFGEGLSGQIGRLENVNGLVALDIGTPLLVHDLVSLGKLTQLERLSLPQDLALTVTGARQVAKLTNLKSLIFYSVEVDDASFAELKTLVKLEVLYLYRTRITDEGIKTIENMPNLRRLICSGFNDEQFTDGCIPSIMRLKKLESLSISGKITNDGLRLIAKSPKLKTLSIPYTDITGDGLAGLEDSTIENLTISPYQAGSSPFWKGAANLKKCKSLKDVMVNGQPTRDEAEWQRILPDVGWGSTSN